MTVSNETSLFVSGQFNRHNVQIWGYEHPHVSREHIPGNGLSVHMHDIVINPFSFPKKVIIGTIYNLIYEYLLP